MSRDYWQKDFDNKFPQAPLELKQYIQSLVDENYDMGHLEGYDEGLRESINKND